MVNFSQGAVAQKQMLLPKVRGWTKDSYGGFSKLFNI